MLKMFLLAWQLENCSSYVPSSLLSTALSNLKETTLNVGFNLQVQGKMETVRETHTQLIILSNWWEEEWFKCVKYM